MNETDLAGPMVFCLAFGATLLLVRHWLPNIIICTLICLETLEVKDKLPVGQWNWLLSIEATKIASWPGVCSLVGEELGLHAALPEVSEFATLFLWILSQSFGVCFFLHAIYFTGMPISFHSLLLRNTIPCFTEMGVWLVLRFLTAFLKRLRCVTFRIMHCIFELSVTFCFNICFLFIIHIVL